jgi:hypothetical protein
MTPVDIPAPIPESRAARRAAREEALRNPVLPPLAAMRHPLAVVAGLVMATVLSVAAFADHRILAAAVAWGGLVIAWGWPGLLGSSSRYGASAALAVVGIGAPVVVAATPTDPFLRYVPGVLALGLVLMFLHQLVRRDGRPHLTLSITATAAGLAVLALGVCLVPLGRTLHGPEVLTAAVAAAAVGGLADLLAPSKTLRPWMLPLAMLLGAGASAVCAVALGHPSMRSAVLIGLLCAAVAQSMRRVLSALPPMTSRRGQFTSGLASVFTVGVVAYVLGRVLVG